MSHVSLNVIQIYHVITNNSDATKLFYCSHIYFKVNNLYIIHLYKCTCSINEKEYHPSLQTLHHMTDASQQSVFRTETQLTQVSWFQLNVSDFREVSGAVAYRGGGLGCSNPPPKFRRYRWSPRSHEQEEPASRFPFVVHCVLIGL